MWLLGGILSLLGALTYGELGARDSASGGLYVYIRDAFGRLPAFLYGWTLFFVISSGSLATLAVAFSRYLDQYYQPQPGATYARDADYLHYVIESWRARDQAPRIADPALFDVNLGSHLDPAHAATLFKRIDPKKAYRDRPVPPADAPPERIGRGTTAFAVADADGNMIAVTQTLSTWGGTFYVSDGLGFLYNNHLRFGGGAPGRFLRSRARRLRACRRSCSRRRERSPVSARRASRSALLETTGFPRRSTTSSST